MENKTGLENRVLGRRGARELTQLEIEKVKGGNHTRSKICTACDNLPSDPAFDD